MTALDKLKRHALNSGIDRVMTGDGYILFVGTFTVDFVLALRDYAIEHRPKRIEHGIWQIDKSRRWITMEY